MEKRVYRIKRREESMENKEWRREYTELSEEKKVWRIKNGEESIQNKVHNRE